MSSCRALPTLIPAGERRTAGRSRPEPRAVAAARAPLADGPPSQRDRPFTSRCDAAEHRKVDLSRSLLPASPDHLRFDDRRYFAARVLETAQQTGHDNPSLTVMMERHLRDAPEGGGGPGFQHKRDLGDTAEEIALRRRPAVFRTQPPWRRRSG
jgi:hypothetical protein